jgi:hypothetical protein
MKLPSRKFVFGLVAFCSFSWFGIREIRNEIHIRRAFPVIRELGGRIGSIPFWPFGCEYRITFRDCRLSEDDLQRLVVLNDLTGRNSVGIAFVDTNLTEMDVKRLRTLLPHCGVVRRVNGETQIDR